MNTPVDLDAAQTICDAAGLDALRRIVPALIAELREARAILEKLPRHCGDEACQRPIRPDSCLCSCSCDGCVDAEDHNIFAHEATL